MTIITGTAGNDIILSPEINGELIGLPPASTDDVLNGAGGDDVLHAGGIVDAAAGRTRLLGGPGKDLFVLDIRVPGASSGSVVIGDFVKGQDRISFVDQLHGSLFGFDFWDSNKDGVLTFADDHVTVKNVTVDGVTKFSTVFDTDTIAGDPPGNHQVVLHGTTGLTAANFQNVTVLQPGLAGTIDYDNDGEADPPTSGLRIVGTAGNDEIDGTPADDRIFGQAGDDVITGQDGADKLYGGDGDDDLYGGLINASSIPDFAGRDELHGGSGRDFLEGGPGDDRLFGEGGDDRIHGGSGNDRHWGGPGADRFFTTYDDGDINRWVTGSDVIFDFVKGQDKLVFGAVFNSLGENPILFDSGDFFDFLDSNADGRLTWADEHVKVKNVTIDGATKFSTVLDTGAFAAEIYEAAENSPFDNDQVVLFGTTGLQASDFG